MNDFNDFREITIEDQELIAPILKRMQPIASEFTFPYLYSWRKDYNLRFGIFGNHSLPCYQSKDGFSVCLLSHSRGGTE